MDDIQERDSKAFTLVSSISAVIAGVVLLASVLLGTWDAPASDGTPVQGGADTPTPVVTSTPSPR